MIKCLSIFRGTRERQHHAHVFLNGTHYLNAQATASYFKVLYFSSIHIEGQSLVLINHILSRKRSHRIAGPQIPNAKSYRKSLIRLNQYRSTARFCFQTLYRTFQVFSNGFACQINRFNRLSSAFRNIPKGIGGHQRIVVRISQFKNNQINVNRQIIRNTYIQIPRV